MSRSGQTFGKKEREKKRELKRKEKAARKEDRKSNNLKGQGLDQMVSYLDANGRPTDTPPDPTQKVEIEASDIQISIPKKEEEDVDPQRKGKVAFYNDQKGYGFITDAMDGEKYFFHINNSVDDVKENQQVAFELEKGPKGLVAVRISLV